MHYSLSRIRPALAGIAATLLVACGAPPTPPEEAVRAWLTQAELAAEASDRPALMEMISPAYSDARGYERADIDRMFRVYFLRQKNVTLLVDTDDVQIHGDDIAEVSLTVGMAATNNNVLGFSADAWQFELELRADGDRWLLIGARWGELGSEMR